MELYPFLAAFISLNGFVFGTSQQQHQTDRSGSCQLVKFAAHEDVLPGHALEGHVFKRSTVDSVPRCQFLCRDDCRCVSMNYIHTREQDNCELSDVNKEMKPEASKSKFGTDYYDLGKAFINGQKGCFNKCCQTNPCLHGGTCQELCNPTTVRFNCTCPSYYTGQRCEKIKHPRSCKDLSTNGAKTSGVHYLYDSQHKRFPVYCDFDSDAGYVWALIQSFSLKNNNQFKSKGFGVDFPVNEDSETIDWTAYRLSLSSMQSIANVSTHLSATCNFPDDGVVYTDYARAELKVLDVFNQWPGQCRTFELINIRGIQCNECTVGTWQVENEAWHINSHYGGLGCQFDGQTGAVVHEQNFGLYNFINEKFRCTSSPSATTQFWIGSGIN